MRADRSGVAVWAVALGACVLAAPVSVEAGAVITSGPVSLGVFDEGNLGFGGTGLGFAGVGDAITPGCLCEGWGVAGSGISGYANFSVDGIVNLTLDSFGSTATTATSMVSLTSLPSLSVTQAYAPSVGAPIALFENVVTIVNTGGETITDVRYRRVMDWDIPPTAFSEFVTIGGLPAAAVTFTNDQGFDSADPLSGTFGEIAGCGTSVNFTDCGPADHGAHFDFAFGDLDPDESVTFSIFYGATPSQSSAFAALAAVEAEVYSFGQNSIDPGTGTPATYIFAFKGVGGTPVSPGVIPEPASFLLMGSGLAGLAWRGRRKQA